MLPPSLINDSTNISLSLVRHLFLPVFQPLKVFIITCLPSVAQYISLSSLSSHLQGSQTTLSPVVLRFPAFQQVSKPLSLFPLELLWTPSPVSSLPAPTSPNVSTVLRVSQHGDKVPSPLLLETPPGWLWQRDRSRLAQECIVVYHKTWPARAPIAQLAALVSSLHVLTDRLCLFVVQ